MVVVVGVLVAVSSISSLIGPLVAVGLVVPEMVVVVGVLVTMVTVEPVVVPVTFLVVIVYLRRLQFLMHL